MGVGGGEEGIRRNFLEKISKLSTEGRTDVGEVKIRVKSILENKIACSRDQRQRNMQHRFTEFELPSQIFSRTLI